MAKSIKEQKEGMSEDTKKSLQEISDNIQPDKVRERDLEGVDAKGAELYDKMNIIYKQLCKDDVNFCLTFLTPTECKPIVFFKMASDINDQTNYQKTTNNIMGAMYNFLCWGGFIKWLDSISVLKILPKGSHKTQKDLLIEKGIV